MLTRSRIRRILVLAGIGAFLISAELLAFRSLNRSLDEFAEGMAILFQRLSVAVDLVSAASKTPGKKRNERKYTAPDGGLGVVVAPVSKETGRSEYESRIDFKTSDGKVICALDYSSQDNEHGFGVVKAEWTPDSQYFVFSLTSSGGHQAWHSPTQFFSRKDETIRSLDDYFAAAGISKSDFEVIAPNTVKTEVWEGKAVPVSVELANLPPLRSWRKPKPFSISCRGGRVFRPEQP